MNFDKIVTPSSQVDTTLPLFIVESYERFVEFMEYAIRGNETDWEAALSKHSEADVVKKGSVSIRKRVNDDSELPKSKKQKKN